MLTSAARGVAARRRDGDRRRGARGRRRPSAAPTWRCRSSGSTRCSTGRRSASGCRRPCGRSTRSPGSSAALARSPSCSRRRPRPSSSRSSVPVEDMTALGDHRPSRVERRRRTRAPSRSGPHVEERIVDLVRAHRSTIVFANSRRLAERLTARLNEIARTQLARRPCGPPPGAPPGGADGAGRRRPGAPPEIARAHHGSVSARAARPDRGGAQGGPAAGRRRDQQPRSSASTWAPSTWSSRSSRRRRWRAACSGSAGPGTRSARCPAAWCSRSTAATWSSARVVAERMVRRRDRGATYPRNPLDVLAQQIVAMVAMEPWTVDELAAVVRRAGAVRRRCRGARSRRRSTCWPAATRATSSPSCGRASSGTADTGVLTGRPGAQRLAVTSGGTIPDRGLFGVFLVGERELRRPGSASSTRRWSTSRGSATCSCSARPSWRIEDITHDRVLVTPAPGQPGKLPFWQGDAPGRPVELGRALGAFLREISAARRRDAARAAADAAGLDEWAADQPARLPRRAARGDRTRARRPHDRGRAVPRRARRLAGRGALAVRRAGARAVGAGGRRPAARALRRRRAGDALRRRHRAAAARDRRRATRR